MSNWDPEERPIFVLGSAFDGFSLGKYIFDWTVFRHGGGTPMADMAGDFWLLLIELTVRVKGAEEGRARKLGRGGELLQLRVQGLIDACETFMWEAGSIGPGGEVKMGLAAGEALVDSMFGRDRKLSETEGLMNEMRRWIRKVCILED